MANNVHTDCYIVSGSQDASPDSMIKAIRTMQQYAEAGEQATWEQQQAAIKAYHQLGEKAVTHLLNTVIDRGVTLACQSAGGLGVTGDIIGNAAADYITEPTLVAYQQANQQLADMRQSDNPAERIAAQQMGVFTLTHHTQTALSSDEVALSAAKIIGSAANQLLPANPTTNISDPAFATRAIVSPQQASSPFESL